MRDALNAIAQAQLRDIVSFCHSQFPIPITQAYLYICIVRDTINVQREAMPEEEKLQMKPKLVRLRFKSARKPLCMLNSEHIPIPHPVGAMTPATVQTLTHRRVSEATTKPIQA